MGSLQVKIKSNPLFENTINNQVINRKGLDFILIRMYSIVQRMLNAGANGYFLKNASADEVISGIRNAVEGETVFSKAIDGILKGRETGYLPVITWREKEVLALLASGLSTVEIGHKIFISPLTVESHRRNLLQKFKVNNVAALVHKVTELKYI